MLRLIAALLMLPGCFPSDATGPQVIGSGTRILFIGNSLTYVNDVPGILQALADAAGGEKLAIETIGVPNYALIDHWIDGVAQKEIDKGGWAYVVMQQGWTPAGVCRDTLRLAATLFSQHISRVGAKPVMFEPWVPAARASQNQFLTSMESYRLAAEDVNAVVFPVAEAWLEATTRNPDLALYSDGLHATPVGSYLAALVMYTRIFNRSPVGLPGTLLTSSGIRISVDAATTKLLQEVARGVGLAPTPPGQATTEPYITSRC
jgi:hypothetical protein